MANAVYNSFEKYLTKDTSNPVPHNNFDLSHIVNFTTCYGALIPFTIIDCLPTDRFNISNIIKVQALPLSNPLFNNVKIMTWWFFTPYQLLWRKFEKAITGGRDGTFSAEWPRVNFVPPTISGSVDNHNTILDYFGLPVEYSGTATDVSVSAFPFAAYEHIYRDYFLNQDCQTSTNTNPWFPDDDDEFSLRDGLNIGMGKTSSFFDPVASSDPLSTGVSRVNGSVVNLKVNSWLDTYNSGSGSETENCRVCCSLPYFGFIRFKNWRRDYFTAAMFSPQRGPAVTVSPSVGDLSSFMISSGLLVPAGLTSDGAGKLGAGLISETGAYSSVFTDASLTADVVNTIGRISSSGSFTITDIMTASQIQLWLARNMQVKAQFTEFLRVHFGDSYTDERLTKPQYIGGTVQSLNISQVLQTSESSGTPQGTATGHANSVDSQFVGKYYCREFGLLMGIMTIVPDAYYTSGVDHTVWIKKSRFDFVFPEFSQLGPEPIFDYELFATYANFNTLSIFGYSGRLDRYRHIRSKSLSDLRNPAMADFYSWNITREFSSTPSLNSNAFISTCKKMGVARLPASYTDSSSNFVDLLTVRTDHFPTGNVQNPFIVQIGCSIKASRPIPFRNEPQALNLRTN